MKLRILLAVIIYIAAIAGGIWTYVHGICPAATPPVFTLVYIAAWTLLELWVQLAWKKNKLLYQTMAILAGISGAWLIAMMTIVCGQMQTQLHLLIPGVFAGWLLTMYTIRVFLSCQWK